MYAMYIFVGVSIPHLFFDSCSVELYTEYGTTSVVQGTASSLHDLFADCTTPSLLLFTVRLLRCTTSPLIVPVYFLAAVMDAVSLPFELSRMIMGYLIREDAYTLKRAKLLHRGTECYRVLHGTQWNECWECDNFVSVYRADGARGGYMVRCNCPDLEESKSFQHGQWKERRWVRKNYHRILYLNSF